jgi:predicted hotdog family 3-hydroxylacyl-ACP dehydratase
MLLVGRIESLDDEQATVVSVANENWPLFVDGAISPLVLVELVAQTAGVHNGMKLLKKHGPGVPPKGWLVGVKQATFHVDVILSGQSVTTTARNVFVFEDLREISGTASIDGEPAGEVVLQVVEAK